jgi:hypothetical protein
MKHLIPIRHLNWPGAAVLILSSGALFGILSCALSAHGDYGTLVITLPGGAAQAGPVARTARTARAAVSDAFSATLTYRIDCDGPGGRITRDGQAGASLSIPLDAGDWAVTVTVFNAASQSIGGATAAARIESGGTTALRLPVVIDTGGRDITGFALTSPVSAGGAIVPNSTAIAVPVPFGTDLTGMGFTLTHTGVSVSPLPGTRLDFSSPRTFTVTAENGQTKTYTVTVTPTVSPPPGGAAVWPLDTTWQSYGLLGITQPGGTTVYAAAVSSGTLIVYLQNADTAAFDDLVNQMVTLAGIAGTASSESGYSMYELGYTLSGTGFTLTLTHTGGILLLSVEPDDPGSFVIWPDNSKWTVFNLAGLTQPAGTVVEDVTEMDSPSTMLSVMLKNIDNTAYEDLRNQIIATLGNPYYSDGSDTTQTREDTFILPMDAGSLIVNLMMDTSDDVIEIYAMLSTGPLL